MQKLNNLQTLRAIAACLVIVCHSIGNYVTWKHLAYPSEAIIWGIGKLGVGMFFVISGFIMMFMHHNDFQIKGAMTGFYLKRLVRVVPMYWLFTIIVALKIYLQGRDINISDLLKSLLFIPYQNSSGLWRPIHDLGWTLNLEMYFYVIFGLALLFNKKIGQLVLFITILFPLIINQYYPIANFYSEPVVVYFLIGVFIFYLKNLKILKLNVKGTTFFLFSVILIASIYSLNVATDFFTVVLVILLPLLAVICTSSIQPHKTITNIGNASYSLYLVHPLVIGALLSVFKKLPVPPHYLGLLAYVMVSLLISMIVAHKIFIWVEQPLVNFFKKNTRHKTNLLELKNT